MSTFWDTKTGLAQNVLREFDAAIQKHTEHLYEELDNIAMRGGINSAQMRTLFSERVGDLLDGYVEWMDEGWDAATVEVES